MTGLIAHDRVLGRRAFLTAAAGTVVTGTGWARAARQARSVPRVGLLLGEDASAGDVFAMELARLGYVDGRDLHLQVQVLAGGGAGLPAIVEAAGAGPDVLVVVALPVAIEVRKVNPTVPMVVVTGPALSCSFGLESCPAPGVAKDPAAVQPDPNVTGIDELPPGVTAKRLTLLKTAIPALRRIALLSTTPGVGGHEVQLADAEQAAGGLGVEVRPYRALNPEQLRQALDQLVADGNEGLVNFQGGLSLVNRRVIIEFAAKHRLPAMYQATAFPESGGLMAWAPDLHDQFRQAADYVARILGGASAGDLPIRHPLKYYLVVNASAAQALGTRVAPEVLAQADRMVS